MLKNRKLSAVFVHFFLIGTDYCPEISAPILDKERIGNYVFQESQLFAHDTVIITNDFHLSYMFLIGTKATTNSIHSYGKPWFATQYYRPYHLKTSCLVYIWQLRASLRTLTKILLFSHVLKTLIRVIWVAHTFVHQRTTASIFKNYTSFQVRSFNSPQRHRAS